jgi:hypothetical protein
MLKVGRRFGNPDPQPIFLAEVAGGLSIALRALKDTGATGRAGLSVKGFAGECAGCSVGLGFSPTSLPRYGGMGYGARSPP